MRLFSVAILICIFLLKPFAVAEDLNCTPTPDLSQNLGPVFNQGDDLNSCFANTGADQLTQKMQREGTLGTSDRIQPLALWALYILDNGRIPNSSKGVVSTVHSLYGSLWGLQKRGMDMLCRESEIGPGNSSTNPLFFAASVASMAKVREQLESPSVGSCKLDGPTIDHLRRQTLDIKNAAYFAWWNKIKKNCHTKIPQLSWKWYWEDQRTPLLRQNENVNWPPANNEPLATRIDDALSKGSLAGIEYQASFLLSAKKQYMHWSNIVERKPVGGKCFYRIRDSFGPDCTRYKDPKNCKDGYIWVEKQELLNHTDAVIYLDGTSTT